MLHQKTVKARKDYKCYECRQPIVVGQSYEDFYGKFADAACQYRTCLLCVEIRTFFSCDGTWIWGSVWEDLQEGLFADFHTGCLEVQPDDDKEPLSAAAKQKVVDAWRKWKGLAA